PPSCQGQASASPWRSAPVASTTPRAPRTALATSESRLAEALSVDHDMAKSASGCTEPSLAGRSRTWPNEASTLKLRPRYLLIVFAFAGDSTTTTSIFWKIPPGILRRERRPGLHNVP